jgi:hypothetical protein
MRAERIFSRQARRSRGQRLKTTLAVSGLAALLVTGLLAPAATALARAGSHAGSAAAGSRRPGAEAAAVKTAAGTYLLTLEPGGSTVALTLNADGTSRYSSTCRGLWIQQGKIIAFDVDETCGGATYAFSGTVGGKGLSSAKKPGELVFHFNGRNSYNGWYGVKTGAAVAPDDERTLAGLPFSARPAKPKAGGDYGFYDGNGNSNDPLALNSDGTADLTLGDQDCTGLLAQSGQEIAWDWNNAPFCSETIFVGTVSSKGLSSASTPGLRRRASADGTTSSTGTWYAVGH